MIIGFLIMSGYSYGQMDMSLCKMMIEDINIKECRVVKVVFSDGFITFDNETVEFTYNEKYLKITDEKGMLLYITYNEVKAIVHMPYNNNRYETFALYLKN